MGGRRLGMMIARANWRALSGSTECMKAPSRRCRCQSSGRVSFISSMPVILPECLKRLGTGCMVVAEGCGAVWLCNVENCMDAP